MALDIVTGNHAAGYALSRAGEANRGALGAACGIYPITPQTEIIEYVSKFPFTKGAVVPVESEHSAMGVAIGASLAGARSFTASSSNGLAYMAENIMVAGYYRCPIVMAAVNRTLGPPWNIWADQGDTLMLRDLAWLQLYCETNQEVLDTLLMAFAVAEDPRVMLPAMVIMDAFIMSHTQCETDLPEQAQVDAFLAPCEVPHRTRVKQPATIGGLVWPLETMSQRLEVDEALQRVPEVYEAHRARFIEVFGRDPGGPVQPFEVQGAEIVLIATESIATTAREVVRARRAQGEKVGLIKLKMFRPFPSGALAELLQGVKKVGVLDRNYGASVGGIFGVEIKAALQGRAPGLMVQDYMTGVGGGDVTQTMVQEVLDDLLARSSAGRPVWKGLES